jgi:hypothetical protein
MGTSMASESEIMEATDRLPLRGLNEEAALLGMNPSTLSSRIRALHIERPK